MAAKSVLLLGATGLVGSECLKLLINDNYYERIVLFHRRPAPEIPENAKIEQHIVNFDSPQSYHALIDVDHVICALGTTIKKARSKGNFYRVDFAYPYEISTIAVQKGAQHLLLISASGANSRSKIFYSRVKGELEDAVLKLNFRSISIFRPALLLGDRKEFRPGEEIAKAASKVISFAIPPRYKPIHARVVAGAILKVARENRPGKRIIESGGIRKIYNNKAS